MANEAIRWHDGAIFQTYLHLSEVSLTDAGIWMKMKADEVLELFGYQQLPPEIHLLINTVFGFSFEEIKQDKEFVMEYQIYITSPEYFQMEAIREKKRRIRDGGKILDDIFKHL